MKLLFAAITFLHPLFSRGQFTTTESRNKQVIGRIKHGLVVEAELFYQITPERDTVCVLSYGDLGRRSANYDSIFFKPDGDAIGQLYLALKQAGSKAKGTSTVFYLGDTKVDVVCENLMGKYLRFIGPSGYFYLYNMDLNRLFGKKK